jgi:UPF0716 protein FxsA
MGLFILLYPLAEILMWSSFIQNFGWGDAFLWCLLSGFVGLIIMRMQGGAALLELQTSAQQGKMPGKSAAHRLLMSLGGLLLIMPGLLSDLIGVFLILPGTRHLLVWFIYKKTGGVLKNAANGGFARGGPFGAFVFTSGGTWGQAARSNSRDVTPSHDIIDVQATVVSDEKLNPPKRDPSEQN